MQTIVGTIVVAAAAAAIIGAVFGVGYASADAVAHLLGA